VPLLVLGSLVLLVLFIAVVRAAASARGEQKGALCFLSKLGIQIGEGCGTPAVRSSSAVAAALSDLVEATPRVKDVASSSSSSSSSTKVDAAPAASGGSHEGDAASGDRRKLLHLQRRQQLGVIRAGQQLTGREGRWRSSLAGT
jgi:hypothetical protein